MIIYFADRQMNIIGQASTGLPDGLTVTDDIMTVDIETGAAIFECTLLFDATTRDQVQTYAEVGNYLLRSHSHENEFYTIIDAEIDTKKQQVYLYAEDAGLDLLNEVVGPYEADQAYPISHYVNKYASGAGFQIGINEASGLTRKLSWDGEATAQERLLSVATQFDNCEISFTFDVDGLYVVRKYVNIYRERGRETGVQLRLNYDIDSIVTTKSIANLATALQCTGGTPDEAENPITLQGYTYDDGDFFVDGTVLKSRKALNTWSRLLWRNDGTTQAGGHITRQYTYDTTSQATLCAHAITELKKVRDMEVNYEVDITKLPDHVRVGDRINIVDDAGGLYLSTRILTLEVSAANQTSKAVLGEHRIQGSGISQKVIDLAARFAQLTVSAARAKVIAGNAADLANTAKGLAEAAAGAADAAQVSAQEAAATAGEALTSATGAMDAANQAKTAVATVEDSVGALETAVEDAQVAAQAAHTAAQTAQTKADEAQTSAVNAATAASNAATAAGTAQTTAETAKANAAAAQSTAEAAQTSAQGAMTTARAAKLDAQQAIRDLDGLADSLETVTTNMQANYARKTDLTETESFLQSQIDRNAAQITSAVSMLWTVDETANDAAKQAQEAQAAAAKAQEEADLATADATAAQTAADTAKAASQTAQGEADTAREAAETAQTAADNAEAGLVIAKANLAAVLAKENATQAEITAAQEAVTVAQTKVTSAQAAAKTAIAEADAAQAQALAAVKQAADAQAAANEAGKEASVATALAQKAADYAAAEQSKSVEVKATADAAKAAATQATAAANEAQTSANAARATADSAQGTANTAATTAAAAQQQANEADAMATQAQADLDAAQQRYEDLLANAQATQEELQEAEAAVASAQASATQAAAAAANAQSEADTAAAHATQAQQEADTARQAADTAQSNAEQAQAAADAAQAEVDGLAVRMTSAETRIIQNAKAIELRATKDEVVETLGGYYTKTESDAALTVKADEIESSVDGKIVAVNQTVTEQGTLITQKCQELILQAVSNYVETWDYEEFRQTVQSQLEIMADQIAMTFSTTTEHIDNVNGDLQAKFIELYKYITFSGDGITIGGSESGITLSLDNDGISFSKNGIAFGRWDGNDFYTGNIVVEVNERAQFGNFAFIPRSDGSLSFLKVGG